MNIQCFFPFGTQVQKVEQKDKSNKDIFILGVYASAVHAQWKNINGKILVRALAVCSEPSIFWSGNNANQIISKILIPKELGSLSESDTQFNGPSGRAIDDDFLKPLNLTRDNVWLCDLVPYSLANDNQIRAIYKHYLPHIKKYNLKIPTIPTERDLSKYLNKERRKKIFEELKLSNAKKIILLGDEPIKNFLSHLDNQFKGKTLKDLDYGASINANLKSENDTLCIKVIPLAHPRQVAKLGKSNSKWYKEHQKWKKRPTNKDRSCEERTTILSGC